MSLRVTKKNFDDFIEFDTASGTDSRNDMALVCTGWTKILKALSWGHFFTFSKP